MPSPRVGVIGIPGKWSTEALADALAGHAVERVVIDMGDVRLDTLTGTLDWQGTDLCGFDALVVKKISAEYAPSSLDRLELLHVAEAAGVRVFSPVSSLQALLNRLACTVRLRGAGIPMPDTVVTERVETAMDAVRGFGQAVFKPLFSTKARGMQLLDAGSPEPELRGAIEAYHAQNPVMYIQRRVDLPGRDLGMVFVGGDYLCTYARVGSGEAWDTTIHSGGRYAACTPDDALIELGRRAQAPFNLDFTTVDIAETDAGPVVFEVSAFGGFRGALEGAGMDAADRYARHILTELDASG